jgi:hypothetical protein
MAQDGFGVIWRDTARYDINTFLDVSNHFKKKKKNKKKSYLE